MASQTASFLANPERPAIRRELTSATRGQIDPGQPVIAHGRELERSPPLVAKLPQDVAQGLSRNGIGDPQFLPGCLRVVEWHGRKVTILRRTDNREIALF